MPPPTVAIGRLHRDILRMLGGKLSDEQIDGMVPYSDLRTALGMEEG